MFDVFCLSVALAVGQGSPADQPSPSDALKLQQATPAKVVEVAQLPARPMPPTLAVSGRASVGGDDPVPPARVPAQLPMMTLPGAATPIPGRVQTLPTSQGGGATTMPTMPPMTGTMPPAAPAANGNGGGDCKTCEEPAEKEPAEKGHFMKMLEGTALGCMMERKGITVDGWTAMSYTYSNRTAPALPVTWNDRTNRFLLQQHWVNIGKNLDTESKELDWGWKVAFLGGTDYRYTVVRGLLDDQLKNTRPSVSEPNGFQQNLYGVDIPLFYLNAWLPNVFEGTEVAVGRMFTPFGYESVMAPSTPLMSRSYAFNWAPPFFHTGVMVAPKFNDNWSGKYMIVNGNDVFFDGSDEWRFVGATTWAQDDTSITFGMSLGRGRFNANRPTPPTQTTLGLAFEPAGRNNINVFDLLLTQKLSDDLSYALELIYGYQTNVPAAAAGAGGTNWGGVSGTAHWGSVVNYLTYNFSEQLSGVFRQELFYDAQGQRTGFEGLYCASTVGLQFKPCDSVIFRPEVRYDRNHYSNPFRGNNNIFTAGADLIFKW